MDTSLPSEDFKFEPTSYKIINDTKNKRLQIHLQIAKLTYWVVCVTKYRMKLKKHENVRWYKILRIVRTQLVGTIKVESVDGQVSSIRHRKRQRVNRATGLHSNYPGRCPELRASVLYLSLRLVTVGSGRAA